jgi:hypothetical protein
MDFFISVPSKVIIETLREQVAELEHLEAIGTLIPTCVNASNVAKRFETNRCRLNLSLNHHAEVAALPPAMPMRAYRWDGEAFRCECLGGSPTCRCCSSMICISLTNVGEEGG